MVREAGAEGQKEGHTALRARLESRRPIVPLTPAHCGLGGPPHCSAHSGPAPDDTARLSAEPSILLHSDLTYCFMALSPNSIQNI